ncbi:glycosyl hydrolase family 28 protein [Microbulbifer sp.]|uniref:glycosyl hydrolase family 28 protein n=1 Tax=Microbulbifer sp. TaxID=1908541 RepID=UPI003F36E198
MTKWGITAKPVRGTLFHRVVRVITVAFAFFICGCNAPALAKEELIVYPPPAPPTFYTHLNDDFTVRVREPGGTWQDLYEYNVMVDLDRPQSATMVRFDMDGPVEVMVRKNNGDFRRVQVRPKSAGIEAKRGDWAHTVTFTIDRPRKLSVEFDGDRLHNLHVIANPIETMEKPDPEDPDVIWFGPGVHELAEGEEGFRFPSNKTVYLEAGALLRGPVVLDRVENVKVLGRGMLDRPQRGFEVTFSKNIVIDGPTVLNPKHYTVFCGQSRGLTIRNLKTFSADKWSDGLDFMSCSDVEVDDVFLRTSDDSIAIYGHRWDYYGDVRNFRITNSVLWADVAHPINIGIHGNAEEGSEGEVIENLLFQNIDILEHDEDDLTAQGTMAINVSDRNLARNILFDTIRVEDFQEGQLLTLGVVFNEKYSAAAGRGIENVTFRNVSYTGPNIKASVLTGFDEERAIRGVLFENLQINGRKVRNADEANLDIRDHVSGIEFR